MNRNRFLITLAFLSLTSLSSAAQEKSSVDVPPPKPSAPIHIAADFAGEPAVGQALGVTLTIRAGAAADDAVLSLSAVEPLVVTEPLGAVELGVLTPGEAATLAVTVVPLAGGTSYLSVTVSADIRGRRQSVVVPVAIRLPDDALRQSEEDQAGKSESAVQSLRAVEEIR